jgi:hypothetical protein
MTKKTSVFAFAVLGVGVTVGLLGTGCSKKDKEEEAAPVAAPAQTTIVTTNGAQVQVREESGVSRYSDEGPEIGTVRTTRTVELRKSADNTSPVIGTIGSGVMVNKKARRGAFYLVDFPSTGGMTPGWLDQNEVTGGPLPVATVTTTVTTTAAPPATTAPPAATTTAPPAITVPATATTPPGGRPPIRIPGKK